MDKIKVIEITYIDRSVDLFFNPKELNDLLQDYVIITNKNGSMAKILRSEIRKILVNYYEEETPDEN